MKKFISPFERFFSLEASAGVVLLISALVALFWANSPWAATYEMILHFPVSLHIGNFALSHSLHHWVNDALMVIFFFVAGLEIKRELTVGELSAPKKAALPIFAAVGGMLIPAICYLIFNIHGSGESGWGIPMATDIAFAVGALSLMSGRVPLSLKVFLLTLAIVDDLGAVLVIAFFYSQDIASRFLAFAGLMLFLIYCAKKAGVRHIAFYIFCGVVTWFFVLKSGVHATVAGVILGLMTPATWFTDRHEKLANIRKLTQKIPSYREVQQIIRSARGMHTHAYRLIETMHPYVTWFIMPTFAFFNAGVSLPSDFSFIGFITHPVSIGVLVGLIIGKPIGILLFSFLAIRWKLAEWPEGFNWSRLAGVGCLAGIGFTMSLFISHLSFDVFELTMYSKLSILIASVLAMLIGLSLLASSHSRVIK